MPITAIVILGIAIALAVGYRFYRFPHMAKVNLRFSAFALSFYALAIVAVEWVVKR